MTIISRLFLCLLLISQSWQGLAQTTQISERDSQIQQICLDAYQEGRRLGCPEVQTEDLNLEREPGIEDKYLEMAKRNLRGESVILMASQSMTQIVSLMLTVLFAQRFARMGAGGAGAAVGGGAAVGVGAIGIASVLSAQVNEFFKALTKPITQHVIFPLLKKFTDLFSDMPIAFQQAPYLVGIKGTPTYTISDLADKVYDSFQYYFATSSSKKDLWHPREMLEARRLKFLAIRDNLPPSYEEAITDHLTVLQKQYDKELFETPNNFNLNIVNDNEKIEAQKKFSKVDRIMNLPLKPKKMTMPAEQMETLLNPYPVEIRDLLSNLVSNILNRSMQATQASSREESITCPQQQGATSKDCDQARPIFYLLGAPGTGKTYFVDELGKILKIPVIKLKLHPGSNEFDLVGKPAARYESDGELGGLTKAFSSLSPELNYSNAIVFIDEADKILNKDKESSSYSSASGQMARQLKPFLLELFERNPKPLRLNSLNVSFDVSKITFILAGNSPIVGKTNEFMQRMNVINFGGFSLEKRVGIACTQFGRIQANYERDPQSLADLLAPIVAMSKEDDDRNLGVKNLLKTLDNYVLHLKNFDYKQEDLVKNPFDWKKMLKSNSKSADILSEFALFKKNFEKKKERLALPENHHLLSLIESEKEHFEEVSLLKDATGDQANESASKKDLQRLSDLLRLPMGIKNLTVDESLEQRIDEIFKFYPKHVKDAVMPILEAHISNSEDTDYDTDVNKNVLYFVGEPGTLKTSLVRALAEAMGLPIFEISLEKLTAKAVGGRFPSVEKGPNFEVSYPELTKVFLARDEKEFFPENGIILIDEADRTLNGQKTGELVAQIIKMLDRSPYRRELSLEGMGNRDTVSIDSSRFLYILTGNNLINDVKDKEDRGEHDSKKSAINDRINAVVKFENFELDNKKELAKSMFRKFAKGQKMLSLDEEFLKEQFSTMEEFATFFHELGTVSFRPLESTIDLYVSQLKRKRGLKLRIDFDYRTILQNAEVSVKTDKKKKPAEPQIVPSRFNFRTPLDLSVDDDDQSFQYP